MKKITIALIGLFMMSPIFAQENVKLSLCGKSAITISDLDKCRSIEVDQDGYKVYGFVLRYELKANKMIKEFRMDTNELTEEAIEALKLDKPTKLYIEEINLINSAGESMNTPAPLILDVK